MTQALGNITSADATLVLGVKELYPAGVQLMNFSTDRMMQSDDIEVAQARMGVDGGLAAAYVPNPYSLTITLEASSPSLSVMQSILMAMKVNRTTYECSVTLVIPSISQVHSWRHGVLVSGNPVTQPGKTLEPTTWKFMFQDYNTAGLGVNK